MPRHKLLNAQRRRAEPTQAERVLWQRLRKRALGVRTRRQAPMWGYIADFYVPAAQLVIEVDGGYHDQATDQRRDAILQSKGLRTIRFKNEAVLEHPEAVLAQIREAVANTP